MTKVVGIQFKENGKIYFFNPNRHVLKKKDAVVVETEKGFQYGLVVTVEEDKKIRNLKDVVRLATEEDDRKYQKNLEDARKAYEFCVKKAEELKLNMRLIDATYTFDRKQLFFSFVSDERVDFRTLVKELARKYHTRIELRQVGIRDKAKTVGGFGPCGRELCCVAFLNEFDSISINHAKTQNLALNPTKINGVCGRLMCCLKYETEQYTEMKKDLPKVGSTVRYKGKKVTVIGLNLFKGTYKIRENDTIIEIEVKK